MIKIGLCGASGSGKGYACKIFETYGVKWIDTDGIYRELTKPNTELLSELKEFFGGDIITEDGNLDRRALAVRVFESENSKECLKELNRISHYHIKIEVLNLIQKYEKDGTLGVVIDAPVLFESEFDKMCDVTICVTAPIQEKITRIMSRDNITEEKAMSRLANQLSDGELRERCDYEIDNSEGKNVEKQIALILKKLQIIKA